MDLKETPICGKKWNTLESKNSLKRKNKFRQNDRSAVKSQLPITAISNTGLSPWGRSLGVSASTAKSFGFGFRQKKIKTNKKIRLIS